MGKVFKDLKLSAEQKAKIKDLRLASRKKMTALVKDSRKEVRAARLKLREDARKELKGVLNDEQFQKVVKAFESRRSFHRRPSRS
jgi:Spy/CpxP family protein refolding chaperone